MKRILLGIVVLMLFVSLGHAKDQSLQLTIKSDKQVYEVGEEIRLDFCLKNIGDVSAYFNAGTDCNLLDKDTDWLIIWRPEDTVETDLNLTVHCIVARQIMDKGTHYAVIDAGSSQDYKAIVINDNLQSKTFLSKSGKYLMKWFARLEPDNYINPVSSGIITIEIKEKK